MWQRLARPNIDASPTNETRRQAMSIHPYLLLALAHERQNELIAESDRERLLTSARKSRRARKALAVRGQPTGTLTSCEPSAAVPAR
jgi:hypothetical protein